LLSLPLFCRLAAIDGIEKDIRINGVHAVGRDSGDLRAN
jgi:hypothetical protein